MEDVARVDPSGMYATVLSSPEAFRSHLRPAPFSLPPFPRMLFTGMGGSAIAGDVLAGVLEEAGAPAEIVVRRSRDLPSWVDTDTLVLLSSYSGNTKDVNMLARQALSRGLQMVAVTSGGELSRWAEENSIPSLLLPSGIPPRAAFPQALATLFSLISS
ncbi:MAG: SIS domain-containing protein, partial [Thermoplasmata archaeon]|nr:SIS domain-containing protein [Thermoplasmata archaeon]